jgi:hypothetical protein
MVFGTRGCPYLADFAQIILNKWFRFGVWGVGLVPKWDSDFWGGYKVLKA